MDFMLIMLSDREIDSNPEVMAEMGRFAGGLASQGKLKGGAPLKPEQEGARIRVSNGEPLVATGPFVETREVIGGYFVIECDSYDEALEIAKRCPHMLNGLGPVELREVIPMGGPPA